MKMSRDSESINKTHSSYQLRNLFMNNFKIQKGTVMEDRKQKASVH